MKYAAWMVIAGVSAYSFSALAQSGLPEKMKSCAAITDDASRLTCYDTAVASLDAEAAKLAAERKRASEARAREAAAKAEADRKLAEENAAKAKVDSFGAAGLPADRKPDTKSDSIDELEGSIVEVFYSQAQSLIVVLENGQMWRQIDGISLPPVRAGDKVVIKKRALSGFRLTLVRQKRTVDVKRYR